MGRSSEAFHVLNHRPRRKDLGTISYLSPDEVEWLTSIRLRWLKNICESVSNIKPKGRRRKIRPIGDIC